MSAIWVWVVTAALSVSTNLAGGWGDFEVDQNADGVADGWTWKKATRPGEGDPAFHLTLDGWVRIHGGQSQAIQMHRNAPGPAGTWVLLSPNIPYWDSLHSPEGGDTLTFSVAVRESTDQRIRISWALWIHRDGKQDTLVPLRPRRLPGNGWTTYTDTLPFPPTRYRSFQVVQYVQIPEGVIGGTLWVDHLQLRFRTNLRKTQFPIRRFWWVPPYPSFDPLLAAEAYSDVISERLLDGLIMKAIRNGYSVVFALTPPESPADEVWFPASREIMEQCISSEYPPRFMWDSAHCLDRWFPVLKSRLRKALGSRTDFYPDRLLLSRLRWTGDPGAWKQLKKQVQPLMDRLSLLPLLVELPPDAETRVPSHPPRAFAGYLVRSPFLTEEGDLLSPDRLRRVLEWFRGKPRPLYLLLDHPRALEQTSLLLGLVYLVTQESLRVSFDPPHTKQPRTHTLRFPDLGSPRGEWKAVQWKKNRGGLLVRTFERGLVIVNPTGVPLSYQGQKRSLQDLEGEALYPPGVAIDLQPREARFLLVSP